jgi:hypothetical protein
MATAKTIKQIKAQPFVTPDEALILIREVAANGKGEGFVTVFEIEEILDKVAITGSTVSYKGIKAGILEALNRAGEQGINTAYLFAYMRRGGDNVPMGTIEQALGELEREGRIHADRSGGLTVFKIGKAPETPAKA